MKQTPWALFLPLSVVGILISSFRRNAIFWIFILHFASYSINGMPPSGIMLVSAFSRFKHQEKIYIKRKDSEKKHTNLQNSKEMNGRRSEHLQYLNFNKNLYHIDENFKLGTEEVDDASLKNLLKDSQIESKEPYLLNPWLSEFRKNIREHEFLAPYHRVNYVCRDQEICLAYESLPLDDPADCDNSSEVIVPTNYHAIHSTIYPPHRSWSSFCKEHELSIERLVPEIYSFTKSNDLGVMLMASSFKSYDTKLGSNFSQYLNCLSLYKDKIPIGYDFSFDKMDGFYSKEIDRKEENKKISYQASKEIALEYHQQVGKCETVCALTINQGAAWINKPSKLNRDYLEAFQKMSEILPETYRNKYILYRYGDATKKHFDAPVVAKALKSHERLHTIPMILNYDRHYGSLIDLMKTTTIDKPYKEKIRMAIWRGVSTGAEHGLRKALIKAFHIEDKYSNIDVCFTKILDYGMANEGEKELFSKAICSSMSRDQLLQYRYLIAVEGNDVATGLKWMLYSNSVVFMPHPRVETIFGEGFLIPWVHYIPLQDDFMDLPAKIAFCDVYDNICERISKQATLFAKRNAVYSMSEAARINAELMKMYIDTFDINLVDKTECNENTNCIKYS